MIDGAVWWDTADAPSQAELDPGVPHDLDRHPDVLVIGGGAMGLATAALCTRAGLGRVLVIERDHLAAGASGGAAAALTPEPHRWTDPPAFVELGRASLALYRQLDIEWGGALGLRPLEWLIALPAAAMKRPITPPPGIELLDSAGAREAEPQLADVAGALLIHDQSHVHPLRLAAGLAARTGTVATAVEMLDFETAGGRVTRVRTSHGDLEPGVVVFAAGLAPLPELRVPQRLVKGHMAAVGPVPFRLRVALAAEEGLVIQLPDGHVIAGGTLDDGDDSPHPDPVVVDGIGRALAQLLPALAGTPLSHRWCCFRPATGDGQPIIDRVPGLDNAWVTAGHYRTGILMAAATGDAIAHWIATGERPDQIEPFTLARFAT
jgi:glycine oxidase